MNIVYPDRPWWMRLLGIRHNIKVVEPKLTPQDVYLKPDTSVHFFDEKGLHCYEGALVLYVLKHAPRGLVLQYINLKAYENQASSAKPITEYDNGEGATNAHT